MALLHTFVNREKILNAAISCSKSRLIILCPDGVKPSLHNLYKLLDMAHGMAKISDAQEIEDAIFKDPCSIEANTFCCGHEHVNVYSEHMYLYEVHCDESAVDIQVMRIDD